MKASAQNRKTALLKLAEAPRAALFAGPIGAGKTQAARKIADQLGVELLPVDLGSLVSRHIGETEKNIDRLFDEAAKSGAALLFSEADDLFGKRTDVRDANDRHANVAAGYLLKKLEAHPGLAVVITRDRQALDPAFVRRLRHVIDFPTPDE
jgi:SpoVK/Ycf46/Vps4 family AAA+-type ATPase